MKTFTRRSALALGGAAVGYGTHRWLGPKLPVYDGTRVIGGTPEAMLNDASGLSATPVHKHLIVSEGDDALIALIRRELAEAASEGRPFNVGAARHSMGAQAIPRDGTAMTFDNGGVEIDQAAQTFRAHAGARWSQIIAALDPVGLSPAVMQSNNDFGVAATFCVNAHGWPVPYGPMGHTVRSIRMVMADGELVTCSRTENPDLFFAAQGGYGLIGVIVDMEVDAVPNTRLTPTYEVMPAGDYARAFRAAVDDPEVTMAYGRLNVERDAFFEHALLITYREAVDQADLEPATGSGAVSKLAARLYRAQVGSEPWKRFRWWIESEAGPVIGAGDAIRNSLINEPVVTLDDRDPDRTDILHEYFVGFEAFDDFLTACREVIPASYQEFLNVTLRYVAQDDEAMLSYASEDRIAAVMSFTQEMTARGEADMARMTRDLIDRIVARGGAYYLPYRPHATPAQMARAYSRTAEFAAVKRAVDPGLVLRNNLWDSYVSQI